MSAALCTAAVGPHRPLLEVAFPTLERYGQRWGFDCFEGEPRSFDRPASWFKIKMLNDLLVQGYDTVVWLDADACFVGFDRNLLAAAPRTFPLWLVRHKVGDRDYTIPNCGVIVGHNDPLVFDFLAEVWERTQYIDHPWWEQAAILSLLGWDIERPGGLASPGPDTAWTPLVGWLGTEWNSMRYDPHPDPIIRHYTGVEIQARLDAMRADTLAGSAR